MATNKYFKNVDSGKTQAVFEGLVTQAIKIAGFDLYYIARESVSPDLILGEIPASKFQDAYMVEGYLESFVSDQGQGSMLMKFGLEQRDSISVSVSRRSFSQFVTENKPSIIRPREGDLIYIPFIAKGFFEIKFVEDKSPYFQGGARYIWTLKAELFRYSSEEFNTGVTEIDKINDNRNTGDASVDPFAKNKQFETEADGSPVDGFDDDGTNDRGTGPVVFDPGNPFGEY